MTRVYSVLLAEGVGNAAAAYSLLIELTACHS